MSDVGCRKLEAGYRFKVLEEENDYLTLNSSTMVKAAADLEVFRLSFELAMQVFNISRTFPKAETYSLTDQITRSSRSIVANIAEGWGKRIYTNEFRKHLIYSLGSVEETKVWLRFSKECEYLTSGIFENLMKRCDELGAKIYKLHENWKSF